MSGRIYTGYEAAELLSGAAHGPWAAERKNSRIVMSKANKHIAVATICGDRAVDIANTALIAAAPDLAATVVLLSDDLNHVTMDLHAEQNLVEESQRARVRQSLELAAALAEVVRLNGRVAELTAALRDHAEVCSFCGRGGSWCCSERSRRAADVLRSTDAPAGGST